MNDLYNIGARYEIVGRIPNGTSIKAYVLRDKTNGQLFAMEKGMVEQLALNKQIYNCSAQIYGNLVNLKGIKCKLSNLAKYNEDGSIILDESKQGEIEIDIVLLGKVTDKREITGYVICPINDASITKVVNKEEMFRLAADGRVLNVKAQRCGDRKIIRGKGKYKLNDLKTYKMQAT